MRKILFLLLYLSFHFAKAQGDSLRLHAKVDYRSSWELGSNGIVNAALFDFFSTSFIDETLKNELTENLRNGNGIGLIQDHELRYSQWTDSTYGKWQNGFSIHYAYRSRFGLRASREAIELSLYGNASFAGQTVDLLPLGNEAISYSEIGYGILRQRGKWQFSGSANLLFGHSYTALHTERATAFTQVDGEYIDLDAAYTYRNSAGNLLFKGMGASIHAELTYSMEYWNFGLRLRDLGWMQWGAGSWRVEADSTFRFEGQEIPNLFDGSDDFIESTQTRLENSFARQIDGSFGSWLPARIGAHATYLFDADKALHSLRTDVDHIFLPGYFPRTRLTGGLKYGDQWLVLPELSFGGFARWGAGVSARWQSSHWEAGIGISNAQGLIVPANSYGLGTQLSVAYRL